MSHPIKGKVNIKFFSYQKPKHKAQTKHVDAFFNRSTN